MWNLDKKTENIDFPKSYYIENIKFEIIVNFFNKKSSCVKIVEDKIIFRLSTKIRKSKIKEHFEILLKKIEKVILKNPKQYHFVGFNESYNKGYFFFNSQKFYFTKTKNKKKIILKEDIFEFPEDIDLEILKKRIYLLLIKKFSNSFENFVIDINRKTFNYSIKEIKLKFVNSKWGHCTVDNKLMFNLKLLNTDIEICKYVILHELAHIKIKNHSKDFWNLVEIHCRNYKECRNTLKINPPKIFL